MASTLEAFARFMDKVEASLAGPDQPEWSGSEAQWKGVLDKVYTLFRKSHEKRDSYGISCSAIAEVLTGGGARADREPLIEACKEEHRGRFPRQRRHVPYEGDLDELATRQSDEEYEVWPGKDVAERVHAVMRRLPEDKAGLLRRRYFDGRSPTLEELASDYRLPLGALKMRLHRAKQEFKKLHDKLYAEAGRWPTMIRPQSDAPTDRDPRSR